MTDLTAPSARAERDSLATRTEVLDKVKVLSLLPDDMHATTEQVATYFEVGIETIKNVVKRNRDEIEDDGYRAVTRSAFEERFTMNLPSSASTIALFPRRAILRIAMLLRDSTVARQVRTYLLDAEAGTRELDDDAIVLRALEIQTRKIRRLTDQVAELEPRAEVADKILDASGDYAVEDAAKVLCRAGIKTGRDRLFKELEQRKWIYRHRGDGKWRVKQPAIEAGYMAELPQSHKHPRTGARILDVPQPRVNPKGIQRILADHRGGPQLALDITS
ncbi:phage antirepressor KilAC domain-containing protein [Rhodococcus globerulus]|uniref:phage antirepressor KilAC domain-containing protein n=1 Tax=Rhodococcus globerulus TaxID=33008 RepID=UPI0039ECEE8A